MISIIHRVLDLVDTVLHWRFYLTLLAGILLAFWIFGRYPHQDFPAYVAGAIVVAFAIAGFWWQLTC